MPESTKTTQEGDTNILFEKSDSPLDNGVKVIVFDQLYPSTGNVLRYPVKIEFYRNGELWTDAIYKGHLPNKDFKSENEATLFANALYELESEYWADGVMNFSELFKK